MRFFLLALCMLSAWCGAANADEKSGAYLLNPGDVILVSVWREDDLQLEVRVLPDGSVTFPLAGRVEVAGLDSTAVAQKIASRLEEYLPEPSVSVVITDIQGNMVYVLGKVTRPGPVVMTGPTSVLQALSMSGGLDKFADQSAIQVVRRKGDAQAIIPVDYKDLISGQDMATNFLLQPGDTLVVP
jgi:polysaccharide export outer membrane protein